MEEKTSVWLLCRIPIGKGENEDATREKTDAEGRESGWGSGDPDSGNRIWTQIRGALDLNPERRVVRAETFAPSSFTLRAALHSAAAGPRRAGRV
ncbi:hypothetical protein V494_07004 [Pseudogymnoascus sp. VKM F-4513 (FW-928)]|nr:hypothetical protein V494_07004 [Pseudogymnoascus sp. VKM F-4513 (FW-928)]